MTELPPGEPAAVEQQLDALTSPVRMQIASTLEAEGLLSVRELATRLERSPQSLHFHVKRLRETGWIREAARRRTARRPEAVYALARDRVTFGQDRPTRPAVDAAVRAASAVLRQAQREYAAAAEAAFEDGAWPALGLHAQREQVRLTRSELRELERKLRDLTNTLHRFAANPRGRSFVLTLCVAPLGDRP